MKIAQIVRSSADRGAQKLHERRGQLRGENYNRRLKKRTSQTRARLQEKHVHATKVLSKKSDDFANLESLLFDREELKKYVLGYLQTHGFAKDTTIADNHEQTKSPSRHHEHRDRSLSDMSNNNGKYKQNGDLRAHENHGGGSRNEDHSSSKEMSLDHNEKQSRGHSERDNKVETKINRDNAKQKHGIHSGHESHRKDLQPGEHTTNKRNFVSRAKSRHYRHYSPYQFERDFLAKKFSLPVYYSVREEDGRASSVTGYQHLSPHHQGVDTNGKQKDFNKQIKQSAEGRQVISKRNRGGINRDKSSHQESQRRNKNAVKVPSLHALPQNFHQEESKYDKESRDEKHSITRHKNRAHQSSGHDRESDRHGNKRREKSFSKPDVASQHPKHQDNKGKKRSNGRRSEKRDFIAVRPPQSLKLEGFDVEPVHSKLRDQRKRKASRRKEQLSAKKNELLRQPHEPDYKGRRKSTVTSKSHERDDNFKASRAHKKSRHPESERKSSDIEKSTKHAHRKNSKSSLRKDSRKDEQVARKKNIVTSKSEKNNRDSQKGGVEKKSRRKGGSKSNVFRTSSQASHAEKSDTALQNSHSHQKTRRKSSVERKSSKHRAYGKDNHDRGTEKSASHRKKKTTAHKRKKSSKHKDSQQLKFSPSWESLDKRKIPSWYDDAKFGIFVHWGVYSVPSFDSEWFWYKWKGERQQKYLNFTRENFPPGFSYSEFAPMFRAEFFDAEQWAKLVARSGARYFVFTSKHHDGFTNWNSSAAWNWNSVDTGPHRNIVVLRGCTNNTANFLEGFFYHLYDWSNASLKQDELAKAFRNLKDPKVRFCLYYSLFEWFNPHYLKDKANEFKTDEYIEAVVKPQLYDLVNTYQPDYLWTDGDWEAKDTYWKSKDFLAWLFNESPVKATVVVNDRWGKECRCCHGGVCTGNDRYNPGKLQKRKWENAMTIDRQSWGFRRDADLKDYLSIEELIRQLVTTVSCGGNLLMNVGPASDGTISPIFQERLTQMGDWLKVNGDAIYGTRPWKAQNDSVSGDVWYTAKDNHVFAIVLNWPRLGQLKLGDPKATPKTRVTMLGRETHLKWTHGSKHRNGGMVIRVPAIPVSDLPCMWAWVFKLSHVK